MACRPVAPELVAALLAAGFERTRVGSMPGGTGGFDVFRRRLHDRWFLEARCEGFERSVDVGLTVEPGGGVLVGPVHRAMSPAALARALPTITRTLGELARASQALRCPECSAYLVSTAGPDGPFLACAQPFRPGRPFARLRTPRAGELRCRGNLAIPALVVHGEE